MPSASGHSEVPHRTMATTLRSGSSSHPTRTDSYSPQQTRQLSTSRANNLNNVARRDHEQSDVAQAPLHSSQAYNNDSGSAQNDSVRAARHASSRSTHARYSTDNPAPSRHTSENTTLTNTVSSRSQGSASNAPRRRTTVTAQTGSWALGKTIGQGSMGKVKLARNLETGEQVAIKIVPRQSQDEHRSQQDRDRAEHSKEVRTAREAAIVTLVNHPYICGMRDVVRTQHHWYMLFEYVNGGQMLDYIISHGRLKEKQARKFGRQIASALDYCHRNSIVHRDLKIENILISKNADIKIIDFGLSNLFSPRSVLKTFCGSLYFAAPELLQAKAYTGPEVDIWSFGIVLYVLVCGKVPFDDQSMPQLHAKIKKGVVEYPNWLSAECKHIISRMLVTDPRSRATLHEILAHPWLTKGFSGPPDNFLPERESLQLPLDPLVIEKMTGFDFGTADYIREQLEIVIKSDEYQKGANYTAHKPPSHEAEHKKGGVFDFYQRRKSYISKDTLMPPSAETLQLGEDPLNAFSPLISIYYLAREKLEREKQESNPGAFVLPQSPGEQPLQVPGLITPPLDIATSNQAAAPKITDDSRARPRTRKDNSGLISRSASKSKAASPAPPHAAHDIPSTSTQALETTPVKKDRGPAGLLRRFSTRTKRNEREKSTPPPPLPPPSLAVQEPEAASASSDIRDSARKGRERPAPPSSYVKYANNPELLAPPVASESTGRRYMGLGRSISVNSAEIKSRWLRRDKSGTSITTTAVLSEQEKSAPEPIKEERRTSTDTERQRGSTVRTKSLGHARRESIQERRLNRERALASEVPEETDQELADDGAADVVVNGSSETMKPVFLKGLFSVSTTSSKPLAFIRSDIIRVLHQLKIEFWEVKGGFSCRQGPKREDAPQTTESRAVITPHRRRISFAGLRGRDLERDEQLEQQPPKTPGTPRSIAHQPQMDRVENGFTNSDESEDETPRRGPRTPHPPGETTTQVHSDMNKGESLKFEILVVKVPLLSLHGLQFKKVEGNTWQYRQMAANILAELRL